jgi:hypothetical protein
MLNWTDISEKDKKLRETEGKAAEALCKLRYDNTIGLRDPKPGFARYSKECGVTLQRVRSDALAWELKSNSRELLSIGEARLRVSASAEQADVIDVVAKAKGIAPKTVQNWHRDEVSAVRMVARERAEKSGRSVRDEAEDVVAFGQKKARSDAERRERDRAARTWQWIELEGCLANAKRYLQKAARVDADWKEDDREMISHSLEQLESLIKLIRAHVMGAENIDWDAELAKLGGEA